MRTAIIVSLALALCAPAAAQQSLQDRCTSFGELAAEIMRGRQTGTVMSDAMAPAQTDSAIDNITRALIVQAYEAPRFQSPDNQESAVTDFRNKTELACYTAE